MSNCDHAWLQILVIWLHLGPFLVAFSLHMCRNGYLCASSKNSDTIIQFLDPDFSTECKISATWPFHCIFTLDSWKSAICLLPIYLTYCHEVLLVRELLRGI